MTGTPLSASKPMNTDTTHAMQILATRLADDAVIRAAVSDADALDAGMSWDGRNLGDGHAGVSMALFEATLSTGIDFDREAMAHLRSAVQLSNTAPFTSLGLFDGAAGLAAAMAERSIVDERLLPSARRFHQVVVTQLGAGTPPPGSGFADGSPHDVISGTAGQLLYLSAIPRAVCGPDDRAVASGLMDVLADLLQAGTSVTEAFTVDRRYFMPGSTYEALSTGDFVDLGTAHGVAGIALALASAAKRFGAQPVVIDQLRRMRDWLLDTAVPDPSGCLQWPRGLEVHGSVTMPSTGSVCAWCFGSSGPAVALLRIAELLDDESSASAMQASIESNVEAFISTPTTDSSLCHGAAGMLVLHSLTSGGTTVPSTRWAANDALLVSRILQSIDADAPFGIVSAGLDGRPLHDPTFLMGAAGTLATIAGRTRDAHPIWHRYFTGAPNE